VRSPHRKLRGKPGGRTGLRRSVVALAAAAAIAGFGVQTASAAPPGPGPIPVGDPSINPCISKATFSLSLSRNSVVWGQTVGLNWSMQLPSGCAVGTQVNFTDDATGITFSETSAMSAQLAPPSSGSYHLMVFSNNFVYDVGSRHVSVAYPTVSGHPWARITPFIPDEAATFASIVQQPNARLYIQGDVNLDLSGLADIPIAAGVQIIGERNAFHANGPRIFTTSFPDHLLLIGNQGANTHSDNVRITGVRLDGMEPSDPCDSAGSLFPDADGVFIYSSTGVQIDHDEFSHWRGSAINVQDGDDVPNPPAGVSYDRINRDSGKAGVWIHDNYIHDNQHPTVCSIDPLADDEHGAGYGVNATNGGFPYIQGNVFSDNRHSIAGHGSDGDGYTAIGNLFLHPGVDDEKAFVTNYNHQIDMHGLGTCPSVNSEHFNCGQAGLYMEVENNIVIGTQAAGIQLRGMPTSYNAATNTGGMYVHDNLFNGTRSSMLTQTIGGMVVGSGNVFVTDSSIQQAYLNLFGSPGNDTTTCDFDGDGTKDVFQDLAGDFYYYSSRFGRWTYMTTNNVPSSGLTFGDRNGDGLCDVSNASGVVFTMPPLFESFSLTTPVPPLVGQTEAAADDAIAAAGLAVDSATRVPSLSPVGTVLGQSVTSGASVQAGSLVALTVSAGGVALPNLSGLTEAGARSAITAAGLVVGTVSHDVNPIPAGFVDSQSPAVSGTGVTVVLTGSTVNFSVSLGQATVPNILSLNASQANALINSAGLSVGTVSFVNNCIDPGSVMTQNPSAGVHAAAGSTVNYTLSTCSGGGGGGSGGSSGGAGGASGSSAGPILPK
jgi:PASTA domain